MRTNRIVLGLVAGTGMCATLGGCGTMWTGAGPSDGQAVRAASAGSGDGAFGAHGSQHAIPTYQGTYVGRFRASAADLPGASDGWSVPTMRQVTHAHEGAVFDPAAARDGSLIVFASTQHRQTSDLYVQRAGTRVLTRLTNGPGNSAMPSLSPDGRRIAFASDRSGVWNIYVMPISGGRPVQITSEPTHAVHPSWSPDGRRIVYSRYGERSGRWELWVADVEQSSVSEFIGYGLFPQWCPTPGTGEGGADKIVFQLGKERGDQAFAIWTLDYREGHAANPTQIASIPDGALINPTWSPDGKRIIFASIANDGHWSLLARRRPASSTLWMVDVDGTGMVRLTDGAGVDLMPTWGEGSRVYFASDRGGTENLWSVDIADAVELADWLRGRDVLAGVAEER